MRQQINANGFFIHRGVETLPVVSGMQDGS